jgi:hypothetical protein
MRKINPTRRLEKQVRAKIITNPDPVAHPEWGPGKWKSRGLIGPEHPRYEQLFASAFGAGMSIPARLVKNPPMPDDPSTQESEVDIYSASEHEDNE